MGRAPSSLLLLVALFALSFALDHDGSLGTDTGGKVATIEAMVDRADWNPSIGYWAEEFDPDGVAHPFFSTRRTEQGWINVTSLPMIFATRLLAGPLGEFALLVVPIFGSILTCLAAAELGRRFGAKSWSVGFWVAASCSPIWVYGLDFWEHSIGLALMLWGVVALLSGLATPANSIRWMGLSGLMFGLSATMRQEALVFGFVAGIVCLVGGEVETPLRRLGRGGTMAAAALVPLVLNHLLEAEVYGAALRSGRAVGVVSAASGTSLGQRLQEGVLITASPINLLHPLSMLMALIVTVGLAWLGLAVLNGSDRQRPLVLCGLAVLLIFLRTAVLGPSFVPGMFAAVPVAGLGLAVAVHHRDRVVLALALGPLPLVWATQYPGAAEAQWAGRYILVSGLVLAVLGAVTVARTHPRVVVGFVVANVVLSALGVTWLVQRTHEFGEANRTAAATEGVVVFSDSFLAREAAPLSWDQQWLSAGSAQERAVTVRVLDASGAEDFTLIVYPQEGDLVFDGFTRDRQLSDLSYGSFEMNRYVYVRNDR